MKYIKTKKVMLLASTLLLVLGVLPVSAMNIAGSPAVYSQDTENTEMSEVQKVAAAAAAISGALNGYTATNSTTKQDLTSLMESAINNAGITHVSVSWHGGNDFTKTEATEGNSGRVSGQVDLICGSRFASINVDKTIAKLEVQATPTPEPTAKPTTTPTITPTVKPTITPTTTPTADSKLANAEGVKNTAKIEENLSIGNTSNDPLANINIETLNRENRINKVSRKMLASKNNPMKMYYYAIQFVVNGLFKGN